MKTQSPLLLVLLLCLLLLSPAYAASPKPYTGKSVEAAYLRCEYLVDPLGIDETAPRLSWEVQSGERGQRQIAYRVLVASSEDQLKHNQGDLWDTGRVESDNSTGAVYAGKPLASHERCCWKVMLWDKDGKASAWSAPALWSMGLLQPTDWKAQWIGYDKPHQENLAEAPFASAKWIWDAGDEPGKVPKARRLLVHQFTLPADAKVKKAMLYATADDGMKFALNGHLRLTTDAKNDSWKQARMMDVAAVIRSGPNELRVLVQNSRPGAAGLLAKLVITTDKGESVVQVTDSSWKSLAAPTDNWMSAPLDFAALTPVRVLGDYGMEPWGKIQFTDVFLDRKSVV